MKKILYILFATGILLLYSCNDYLETSPSQKVSGNQLLKDVDGAQTIMNGIYRAMYTADWGDGWLDENSGVMAYILAADLMGEDHCMDDMGNGWFYFDYALSTAGDYNHKSGRPYQTWNFFYTIISNANIVLGKESELDGEQHEIYAVMGQAYAMRAFAYFNLIQFYQQSITVDNTAKGVPVYTEPTTINTEGKSRGTIQDVYTQINNDIDKAIELLEKAQKEGWIREHESYVDFFVACGLQARINLAQGTEDNFSKASKAAKKALEKPGLNIIPVNDFAGCNSKSKSNVLWALEVTQTQSEGYSGFFSHMDADAKGMYAESARQCISKWLYDEIPVTDDRKSWWRGNLTEEERVPSSSYNSYCQLKFKYANTKTSIGDYMLMRAEEMILIAAEAECHLENYPEARELIKQLGEKRDSDYLIRLERFTDESSYNEITVDPLVTLMDEILFQRRIELWGENPRLFDLKRLGLGITRSYEKSNHDLDWDFEPESIEFVFPIPQAEFDGNPNMSASKDQNPM